MQSREAGAEIVVVPNGSPYHTHQQAARIDNVGRITEILAERRDPPAADADVALKRVGRGCDRAAADDGVERHVTSLSIIQANAPLPGGLSSGGQDLPVSLFSFSPHEGMERREAPESLRGSLGRALRSAHPHAELPGRACEA